ncbi:MAG: DAK2 domain-containing protein, partial [Nocardioidaceae bacterium]
MGGGGVVTQGGSLVTPEHLGGLSAEIVRALGEAREEIDALNVFPVPDGDTGTNLFLTFDEAHDVLQSYREEHPGAGIGEVALAYKKALLLSARGNSGVIMSQLFGAMLRRLADPGTDHLPSALAASMVEATDAAYAAVGTPVEGTILSVAKAASEAAVLAAAAERATLTGVIRASTARAYAALEATLEQLPQLRSAGVVDAGARGLVVVLEAIETALTGKRPVGRHYTRKQLPTPAEVPGDDLTEGGPAYEVMYLLDADDERVPGLREALLPLGDSLVVVGGDGLWNVHVHVDDVGAAVEAGLDAGRPHRIRVTHFAEQL